MNIGKIFIGNIYTDEKTPRKENVNDLIEEFEIRLVSFPPRNQKPKKPKKPKPKPKPKPN